MKKNVLEYFRESVLKYPNKIAVIDGADAICFSDLDKKAKCLASFISSKSCLKHKPIAVYLPKQINSIIADIAITYSSNIYMNLDVKTPNTRINNILDLIEPTCIISDSKFLSQLDKPNDNCILINLDEINFDEEVITDNLCIVEAFQIDTDPLCIINTSGSTGTPKGVVLNHKSFIDFVEISNDIFKFNDSEIIGSLSPLVFDIYSYELCLLMSNASTLVILPENLASFPFKILEILLNKNVTFLFWVPTIMVNIANLNLFSSISLPSLKTVWFAGEVFPTKQFNYWKNSLPHVLFANLYGPIEITLDCTYFIVNRDIKDDEPLPIGIPYRNTDVFILDDEDRLVIDNNIEGELCVRGTSLAMGYYNNPIKTSSVFVQNPLNKAYPEIIYRTGDIVLKNSLGEFVFKGRKDSLIKHLGYRIELGEIEHVVVNTLKLVKNACLVYQSEKKEIILFYESDHEIEPSNFRKSLLTALPKYMLPTRFAKLAELPRNTNGKIDRLALKNLN
jgi:amino acid adenylation domain-containing protein